MTTIELTAEVGEDHRLAVEVPASCPPGRHRVFVVVDESTETAEPNSNIELEPPLRRSGKLVIIDPPTTTLWDFDLVELVERVRRERDEANWGGYLP